MGILSFLVNPINGIDQRLLYIILKNNISEMNHHLEYCKNIVHNTINYVNKNCVVQNIQQLEKIISESKN